MKEYRLQKFRIVSDQQPFYSTRRIDVKKWKTSRALVLLFVTSLLLISACNSGEFEKYDGVWTQDNVPPVFQEGAPLIGNSGERFWKTTFMIENGVIYRFVGPKRVKEGMPQDLEFVGLKLERRDQDGKVYAEGKASSYEIQEDGTITLDNTRKKWTYSPAIERFARVFKPLKDGVYDTDPNDRLIKSVMDNDEQGMVEAISEGAYYDGNFNPIKEAIERNFSIDSIHFALINSVKPVDLYHFGKTNEALLLRFISGGKFSALNNRELNLLFDKLHGGYPELALALFESHDGRAAILNKVADSRRIKLDTADELRIKAIVRESSFSVTQLEEQRALLNYLTPSEYMGKLDSSDFFKDAGASEDTPAAYRIAQAVLDSAKDARDEELIRYFYQKWMQAGVDPNASSTLEIIKAFAVNRSVDDLMRDLLIDRGVFERMDKEAKVRAYLALGKLSRHDIKERLSRPDMSH